MNDDITDVDQSIDKLLAEVKSTITAKDLSELLMIGIHTGGVWIAERLHEELKLQHPLGKLNIAFYRDDFSRIGTHPQVTPSKLPFDVEDKHILLVEKKKCMDESGDNNTVRILPPLTTSRLRPQLIACQPIREWQTKG